MSAKRRAVFKRSGAGTGAGSSGNRRSRGSTLSKDEQFQQRRANQRLGAEVMSQRIRNVDVTIRAWWRWSFASGSNDHMPLAVPIKRHFCG